MFVILRQSDDRLMRHTDKDAALTEAERLCKKEGCVFEVYEHIGQMQPRGVEFVTHKRPKAYTLNNALLSTRSINGVLHILMSGASDHCYSPRLLTLAGLDGAVETQKEAMAVDISNWFTKHIDELGFHPDVEILKVPNMGRKTLRELKVDFKRHITGK